MPTATPTAEATTATSAPAATVPEVLAAFPRADILVSGETWTVVVADTPALRSQGLMGVSDLGDLDGMLFVFEADTTVGFWMKDTLIPLDVALFGAEGTLVDLLAMVPCADDPCPTYHPSGRYRYALESAPGAFEGLEPLELVVP